MTYILVLIKILKIILIIFEILIPTESQKCYMKKKKIIVTAESQTSQTDPRFQNNPK